LAHASAQKGVVLEWCKHGHIVAESAAGWDAAAFPRVENVNFILAQD
jgi:hypothetical protein